jgi:hypothetical protein
MQFYKNLSWIYFAALFDQIYHILGDPDKYYHRLDGGTG